MSNSGHVTAISTSIGNGDTHLSQQINKHVVDYYSELIYNYEKKKGIK
jgi:hypothetical protein